MQTVYAVPVCLVDVLYAHSLMQRMSAISIVNLRWRNRYWHHLVRENMSLQQTSCCSKTSTSLPIGA